MIEIFDARRTRSFGCFACFSAATDMLDHLAAEGFLGKVPEVSVSAYRNNVLQREYSARLVGGRWLMPKLRKRKPLFGEAAPKRRKRKLCKEYVTAELMFCEAMPEWLNRSYPLSADSLKKCSRKCFIYNRMMT